MNKDELIKALKEYGVVTTKDIADVVRSKDIQDVVKTKDVRDVVRTKDIQDMVRTKDIQDVVRNEDLRATEKRIQRQQQRDKKEIIKAISNIATNSPTLRQFNALERRVSELE